MKNILLCLLCLLVVTVPCLMAGPSPAEGFIFGEWKDGAVGSDNLTTAEINLGMDYDKCNLDVPTMASANLTILISRYSGGTYKQLGVSAVTIPASTGNFFTTIDLGGYQYLKIVSSDNQSIGLTFSVRGYGY